jgi:hypothetical protein
MEVFARKISEHNLGFSIAMFDSQRLLGISWKCPCETCHSMCWGFLPANMGIEWDIMGYMIYIYVHITSYNQQGIWGCLKMKDALSL